LLEIENAFTTHKSVLIRFLEHMVGSQIAEAVLQETFERVLKTSETYRNETSIKNWIFKIAGNLAIDYLRKISRQSKYLENIRPVCGDELEDSHAFNDIIDERPWNLPLEMEDRKEMVNCIAEFINQLQPHSKTLILLREIDNFSISDIADIFDISIENARVRIFRSRAILRKALAKGCHVYQGREGGFLCDRK
jgi:RNA polymerase sigma-70 factor, ECF subfamily